MTPRPEIARLVSRTWPGCRLVELAGDASTRLFFRIEDTGSGSRILMDYRAPFRDDTDDVVLTRIFDSAGLPVPEVLEIHGEEGCLILQDLGDVTLEAALGEGAQTRTLLERAVDLAAAIAELGTPALAASCRAQGPALDRARFRFEMDFFREHFVEGHAGVRADRELEVELTRLADRAAATPRAVMCHRDFHSRNLLVAPDGALWMVDIQDARWGPDSYDLASLLYDAYVESDPRWTAGLVSRYLERLADPPPRDEFLQRLHDVAAQRMIKALGTFGYQIHIRGRQRYASSIPRTRDRLSRLLPERDETRKLHRVLRDSGLLDLV